MYCNYCRSLNPNDAAYCSACGKTIGVGTGSLDNEQKTQKATEPTRNVHFPSADFDDEHRESDIAAVNLGKADTQKSEALSPLGLHPKVGMVHSKDEVAPAVVDNRSEDRVVLSSAPVAQSSLSVPVYASIGQRFTAYFVDLIIIYFLALIFYVIAFAFKLPITGNDGEAQGIWLAALFLYMVVAQTAYHTTVGKYVHGLEVCSARQGRRYPGFWRILLRETFGRAFSSFFWGLGYWMALRKPRVQAWSDELAGTVVTVRSTNRVLVRALTAFVLVALLLDLGLTGYGFYKEDRDKKYAALKQEMDAAGTRVVAALQTVNDRINSAPKVSTWDDFTVWQQTMESLKGDLDSYERKIDYVQGLIQRAISEDLAASEAERNQLVVLQKVYELRKQQAEKYRQEANLVVSCDRTQRAVDDLRKDLELLDSDINGLDSRASQLLAENKIK